jgi:hypothetical protein
MITAQLHRPVVPQGSPSTSRQRRPVQHTVAEVQVWPAAAQVEAWQVPVVAPPGMAQVKPVQQSAEPVHVAPWG